jgi:hypothetical protein
LHLHFLRLPRFWGVQHARATSKLVDQVNADFGESAINITIDCGDSAVLATNGDGDFRLRSRRIGFGGRTSSQPSSDSANAPAPAPHLLVALHVPRCFCSPSSPPPRE